MPKAAGTGRAPLPRISALMPHLFQNFRPTYDGNSPVMKTGSIFVMGDVYTLPIDIQADPAANGGPAGSLHGAFGGYALLKKVAATAPEDYNKLLEAPSKECVVMIGSCGFEDSLDALLGQFQQTAFGSAMVKNSNWSTLVTLAEIIELVKAGSLKARMTAGEVGTHTVSISPDARLKEAIDTMLEHKIRRLFVEGRDSFFVSDRSIIEFMFSGERLALVKDRPEKWIDGTVSDVRLREATVITPGDPISDAAAYITSKPDDCLLTDDGKVVCRWDLVMKPWMAGALEPKNSSFRP